MWRSVAGPGHQSAAEPRVAAARAAAVVIAALPSEAWAGQIERTITAHSTRGNTVADEGLLWRAVLTAAIHWTPTPVPDPAGNGTATERLAAIAARLATTSSGSAAIRDLTNEIRTSTPATTTHPVHPPSIPARTVRIRR